METLDAATAARFAAIALSNIDCEYPHKLDHVIGGAGDVRSPRALHPAFHASFDWHSCVHMHWLLARVRRGFPALPVGKAIDALFDRHFTDDAITGELAYLGRPASASFERPYGWAWLLKLAMELDALACAEAKSGARPRGSYAPAANGWSCALKPLAAAFTARYVEFLPRARYPVRHGVHANSAFGLAFALDYARACEDAALADACTRSALDWYAGDRDAAAGFEPSGADFLSPALMEAALMQRVLDRTAFANWLATFMPGFVDAQPTTLFEPVRVVDRRDPQLVHLDGLNLSRAWCLREIASALAPQDSRATVARHAAALHLRAGWEGLSSEDFVGAHWLASFAALALDAENGCYTRRS